MHWILGEYDVCMRFGDEAVARACESAPGLVPEALRLVSHAAQATGLSNAASAAAVLGDARTIGV